MWDYEVVRGYEGDEGDILHRGQWTGQDELMPPSLYDLLDNFSSYVNSVVIGFAMYGWEADSATS